MSGDHDFAEAVAVRVAEILGTRLVGPLVGVKEAATALGVPESWLAARARNGEAPCRKLGKYTRYDVAELRAWVDATASAGPVTGSVPVTPPRSGQRSSGDGGSHPSGVPQSVTRRAA